MKSSKIMFLYAAFIVVCSGLAFALAPEKAKAMTALYAGGGAAFLMVLCGIVARMLPTHRALGMIGVHIGLVLPGLFAIEFGRRSYKNFSGADGKMYLAIIFAVLAVGSLAAMIGILQTRPKKEDRGG
jgi:hypothetical protein